MRFEVKYISESLRSLAVFLSIFVISMPATGYTEVDVQNAYVLEPIIVTADKREEELKDVPGSVSVISESQLDDYEINNSLDIIDLIPNIYVTTPGSPSMTFATVRGITGGMNMGPSMGFYVDGVYHPTIDVSLYDVERVEVLRGPQGTLYGRGTEAGLINIVTKKPSNFWNGFFSAGTSSFSTYSLKGLLSGPVAEDKLLIKAALRYEKTDGWFESMITGNDDLAKVERKDGRFSLVYTPDEDLDLTLTYDIKRYDTPKNADFALLDIEDSRKKVTSDEEGSGYTYSDGAALFGEYRIGGAKFVSVTSWRSEDEYSFGDLDFSPVDIVTMSYYRELSNFSQELRLLSDEKGDSSLSWIVGCFIASDNDKREYDSWYNLTNMGMPFPGETLLVRNETETLNMAVFGEVTYAFVDNLNLTLGLRYEQEEKDFEYSIGSTGPFLGLMMDVVGDEGAEDASYGVFLPKAAVSYDFSEDFRSYFSVSKGFRSGGFNETGFVGLPYDPEHTWNYELGFKSVWFGNRLSLNAALFYIDWSDIQVEVIIPAVGGFGFDEYFENAAKATSKGFEIEMAARPVDDLELTGGFGYTDATFDEYKSGSKDYSGKKILTTPEYTANIGATYRFSSGFYSNVNYHGFGKMYFDNANTKVQDAYGLINAKVGYRADNFDVYAYGKNLGDKEYVTRAFPGNNTWYGRAGAPRTFGISTSITF